MRCVFVNDTIVPIHRRFPTDISSTIDVSGVNGTVSRMNVAISLAHSYTGDLRISLSGPDSQKVLLVGREGGSGDHFFNTLFDDSSTTSITQASAPFSGIFRPEESLATFNGLDPSGTWTLRIQDVAYMDGGSLNRWAMGIVVKEKTEPKSEFSIQVRFLGGLSASQRSVFETAAARWSEIIIGDLPSVSIGRDVIDDVLIEARGASIDGIGGILGQAGPTRLRSGSLLPVTGIMEFDIGDLARMEADGSLLDVIIHEMGHVLGIGTIWSFKGLLQGAGTANPTFTGANAIREFATLSGVTTPVPVANTGGPGTRDGHWREGVFGSELMTGFLNPGDNPISRLTIASLEDLGYAVNYNAHDPFTLPSALSLAIMGIGAEGGFGRRQCAMCGQNRLLGSGPVILPESATVN